MGKHSDLSLLVHLTKNTTQFLVIEINSASGRTNVSLNFPFPNLSWYSVQITFCLLLYRNFGDQKLFTSKRMSLNFLQFVNEDMYKCNFNSSFLFVFCLSCIWTPKDKHNTYPRYTKTTQSSYTSIYKYTFTSVCTVIKD